MEVWKEVIGSNGKYQVSNEGQVRSLTSLLSSYKRSGYLCVTMTIEKKRKPQYVHRLVAEAFLPNPEGLPFVNHKDEDKLNPHVDNLEWCTHEYNMDYSMAKHYIVTDPEGNVYKVRNLTQFCKDKKPLVSHLQSRGRSHGWTCIKVGL